MRISEIYVSIQGETEYAGLPCTFIRTVGCDLRCTYCDTTYAFHGGREMTISEIISEVQLAGIPMVLLTGGEPMLQRDLPELARALISVGNIVAIETSGAHPLSSLPAQVIKIVDIKAPSSGESSKMDRRAIDGLSEKDSIKFVLTGREDYDWAKNLIKGADFPRAPEILFSPAFGLLSPQLLVEWFLQDRLDVRLNLQLHKFIWGPNVKGV